METAAKTKQPLPAFISRQVEQGSYYFLNLDARSNEDFVVVCGGWEHCRSDYRLEREAFQYLGIEYVVSGRATLTLGGAQHELRPGSLFGYKPNTRCVIESKGLYPLQKRFVDLSGTRASSLFDQSPLGELRPLDLAGVKWVEETFRQLSKFGEKEDQIARRSCQLLAEVLLLQIGEEGKQQGDLATPAFRTYLRCRDFLERQFLELTSIAELASAVRLDQAYLSRLFRRFDEESPYRKLVRLKMNRAARLLMSGSMRVNEVAAHVGYEDALHFSRVFKRSYGLSPRHFAESVRRG